MNDKQFERAMRYFEGIDESLLANDMRARDTAQREALARVEAELAECSAAHANCVEELRAFHAAKPWLVEQQLAEAVGLLRAIDRDIWPEWESRFGNSAALINVQAFLADYVQAEQQEAPDAQLDKDARIALLERELDRTRERADMAEVELQHARAALATQPSAQDDGGRAVGPSHPSVRGAEHE